MSDRVRILAAVGVTVLLFLGVQLGALALVEPFTESERQAVENPEDPTNSALYVVVILIATAFMLAAFRYDLQGVIRALIVGVSVLLSWFVFAEVVPPFVLVGGANALAIAAAFGVGVGLVVHPEWYVIDAAGVLMGAGAAGLFGISFGPLPAIVLLSVLAVYDAISVYKTKHMLDLASGVMDLKVPVLFVVPTTLSYSYRSAASADGVIENGSERAGDGPDEAGEGEGSTDSGGASVDDADDRSAADEEGDVDAPPDEERNVDEPPDEERNVDAPPDEERNVDAPAGDEAESDESTRDARTDSSEPEPVPDQDGAELHRDALFIGLGDAVIPTILVASAASFLDAPAIGVPGLALNAPALGAMVGTIAGLLVLMYAVLQGRPHAGLPLLNGGAIGGYLLGAIASGVSIATAIGL